MRRALVLIAVAACGRGDERGAVPLIEDARQDAPRVDAGLRDEVIALVRPRLAALLADEPPPVAADELRAIGACRRPERAGVRAAVTRWLERTRAPVAQLDLRVGCDDAGGVVVEARAGLARRRGCATCAGSSWRGVVRVRGDVVEAIREAAAPDEEVTVVALADLGGELPVRGGQAGAGAGVGGERPPLGQVGRPGALAGVGGERQPLLRVSRPGALARFEVPYVPQPVLVGRHAGDAIVRPSTGAGLVLRLEKSERPAYRCVTGPRRWTPCAAAALAERRDRAIAAARALIDAGELPGRDELARALALLDVPGAAALAARARPTSAREAVEAFVAERTDGDGLPDDEEEAHEAEVGARLARALGGALGETACPPVPPAQQPPLAAALTRWLAAHDHERIAPAACGTRCAPAAAEGLDIRRTCTVPGLVYALASWSRRSGASRLWRQGVFVVRGGEPALLVSGTYVTDLHGTAASQADPASEGPGAYAQIGSVDAEFRIQGAVGTALVLAPGPRIVAVAGGEISEDRPMDAELAWPVLEDAGEVLVADTGLARADDGTHVAYVRATAHGLETVMAFDPSAPGDPPPAPAARILDGIERDRAALDRLFEATDAALSDALARDAIVDALRRLGASPSLLARVRGG